MLYIIFSVWLKTGSNLTDINRFRNNTGNKIESLDNNNKSKFNRSYQSLEPKVQVYKTLGTSVIYSAVQCPLPPW